MYDACSSGSALSVADQIRRRLDKDAIDKKQRDRNAAASPTSPAVQTPFGSPPAAAADQSEPAIVQSDEERPEEVLKRPSGRGRGGRGGRGAKGSSGIANADEEPEQDVQPTDSDEAPPRKVSSPVLPMKAKTPEKRPSAKVPDPPAKSEESEPPMKRPSVRSKGTATVLWEKTTEKGWQVWGSKPTVTRQ